MTLSWYSLRISIIEGGSVIFNAFVSVDDATNVVQNFYYVNNYQYVDILLREIGNNGSDNLFNNNNFTNGGTNILSVIPFINTNYNNPYKLNLWRYNAEEDICIISYNLTNTFSEDWPYSTLGFFFTFTLLTGLPPLSIPRPFFSMGSLFTNNAQVFYKPHSLSAGGGGSGVRNYRIKKRKT